MAKNSKSKLTCGRCNEPVLHKDIFCQNCGSIFSDHLMCSKHKSSHADGVCVICQKPYCVSCAGEDNKVFICHAHYGIEIYEGMGRVFGSFDLVQANYVSSCFEQVGLHPLVYSRRFNPNPDKADIWVVRNFGNHPAGELKVLVPFSEVLKALKEIKKHRFKEK
jgi:hypothetical protein